MAGCAGSFRDGQLVAPSLRAKGSREALSAVIARSVSDEAIHVSASREMDCFASLAMTGSFFNTHTPPRSRGPMPGFCLFLFPLKRGSRECRVRAAPAVSCANLCEECAHEHTGSAETLRHSPRNGFTAYATLSPATNSSCHRHRRIDGLARPGWARNTCRFSTSNGCQNHMVLPYAATRLRLKASPG